MENRKLCYVMHFPINKELYIHLYAASQSKASRISFTILFYWLGSLLLSPAVLAFLYIYGSRMGSQIYRYLLLTELIPFLLALFLTVTRPGIWLCGHFFAVFSASGAKKQNIPFYNDVLYFFYDTCFEMKSPYADAIFPYAPDTARLCETSKYFILYQDRRQRKSYQAHAIAKSVIPVEQLSGFRDFLARGCQKPCRRIWF